MPEDDARPAPLPMRPEGLRGRLFGAVMERMNAPAYRRAVEALRPQRGQRFLEIGFGTGGLLARLIESAPDLSIAGVDPTETMLRVASRKKALMAASGRVDLRLGSDAPLPWSSASFDGVAALHSFQFWPDPRRSLDEIVRVLKPGGALVLILRDHSDRPPAWLPNPLSRSGRERDAARDLLHEFDFDEVRDDAPLQGAHVLTARKCGRVTASPPDGTPGAARDA